jgi:hypothetical protein
MFFRKGARRVPMPMSTPLPLPMPMPMPMVPATRSLSRLSEGGRRPQRKPCEQG